MIMLFKLAFLNIRRHLRRTLAILVTIAVGAGTLFVFNGFNFGIMNQYREQTIHSRFGYGQVNLKGYRDQVFEKPWEHWMEGGEQLLRELKTISGVTQVFPRVDFPALLTNGSINVSGRGQGIDGVEEARFFTTLNVVQGEVLSTQENGMLLGRGLARALKVQPGDHVTVLSNTVEGTFNGVDLVVTGVFHTGSKDFDDSVFRIPLAKAQALLNTSKLESIVLGLDQIQSWPSVAQEIKSQFPNLDVTSFAVLDEVYYQHAVDWLDAQFNVIQSIILIVVILGIFNTVSTGILERRQEIGNLRANGDSVRDVLLLLCTEGFVLGIVGALIGVVSVIILNMTVLKQGLLMPPSPGITRQFYVKIELTTAMAAKSFILGALTCCVGTLFAAWRVVRMPLAKALRSS